MDAYIEKAGTIFPFIRVEENRRKGDNDIEKRHFRFYFQSPRTGNDISVLLDVVFEGNPYLHITEKPIQNSSLLSEGEALTVSVPDKNCILGDKLTAFAPHTTGIPFGKDKELEIIKQMFDCWTLIQELDDYETVASVYDRVSRIELGYRGLALAPAEALKDTIDSCLCIMGRGGLRAEEYSLFLSGISAIQGHIFNGRLNGENAGLMACEVMYLASCLLTGQKSFERVVDAEAYREQALTMKGAKRIRYIRNVAPSAYAYLLKAFELLHEAGLYRDSLL